MEAKSPFDLDLKLNAVDMKDGTSVMHVSIVPPATGPRKPCVCVCILDISGSMGTSASLQVGVETHGFNRLDLVKHSVGTIINMLDPNDYVALVPFSTKATVLLGLTKTDKTGKDKALAALEKLQPTNSTNIWDGLKVAIDVTKGNAICEASNTNLLLFTDGEPNENPPEGILGALGNYVKGKEQPFIIHSFGYGYSLDSELLMSISNIGNGIFNYIPDTTMVGTIFVNYVSNCLATVAKNAYLNVAAEGVEALSCLGHTMQENTVITGGVQYGQTRDFIFLYKAKDGAPVKISVMLKSEGKTVAKIFTKKEAADDVALYRELTRCKYIDLMMQNVQSGTKFVANPPFLAAIQEEIMKWPSKDDPNMKALMKDLVSAKESEGQAAKAFSTLDWYQKWGAHYIRSLLRAHQLQQCHNFKDPGVQAYGSKYFKDIQNETDKVFCSLPPPKPSIVIPDAPAAAPANMSDYLYYGGGCFDGEGLIKLSNGVSKKVKDIKKGDEIISSKGVCARVVCLVIFPTKAHIDVVDLNGMLITPWHPVMEKGKWVFPMDIKPPTKVYCENIYNLVLDCNHVATINGVDLVTLGHNLHDNSVIEHAYFGTEKVIDDLRKVTGWSEGNVLMERCLISRDPATGLVNGIH